VRTLLRAFLADEALPHSRAEERTLYRAVRRDPGRQPEGVRPRRHGRNIYNKLGFYELQLEESIAGCPLLIVGGGYGGMYTALR